MKYLLYKDLYNMARFILKKLVDRTPSVGFKTESLEENNEEIINEEVMTTSEKINAANSILTQEVKKIKKDKGLIERTESSKIVLTEDNKELLKD